MEYIVKYTGDIRSLGYPTEILGQNYAILELEPDALPQLRRSSLVEYYEPAELLSPASLRESLDAACITSVQRSGGLGLTGKGVAIGLIDSGIDLTHPEFLNKDGTTRVLALWDMTAEGTPPAGFRKGALYSAQDIDNGLAAESRDERGHGTAAAGIAAGKSGVAPEASLLVVKMGGGEVRSTDVMRGFKFVLDEAQRLRMPCAVNLSYGTNLGSHRGQSLFETYIDAISLLGKAVIVCASGNEGSGGHHFADKLTTGGKVIAEFNVSTPRKSIYLTLWKSFADTARFELILPSGATTGLLTPSSIPREFSFGGVRLTVVFSGPTHYATTQQILFRMEAASGKLDGLWALKCYGEKIVDGAFDIWLPTVEEVGSRTAFLRPQPDLTITLPATAESPISVGGYRPGTETISPFSGRGDPECRGQVLLDITAPAENIYTAKAGGGYDTFSGTSMAAPFVTGSAALMMEWGIVRDNAPFLYGQRIKAALCKNALRSSFWSYPNPLWGYGKLQLCTAMADLISQRERGTL